MTIDIRDAIEGDLATILKIYNEAVVNTTAIWNERTVDLDNRREWWQARRTAGYPVLVATDDGEVLGYASFGDFRPFDGFRLTVEHSIYLAGPARRRGAGGLLLEHLVERAQGVGKHVMVGAIAAENEGSIRFHTRHGFTEVGRMPAVGMKFGRRLDLVLMQRLVGEPAVA